MLTLSLALLALSAHAAPKAEVKLTVPRDETTTALRKLGLSETGAEKRLVYFYDTPTLALYKKGVVLRARQNGSDKEDDSTVKIGPLESGDVGRSWLELDGFKCEKDVTPDGASPNCSLTVEQNDGEIKEVAQGRRAIDKLFSQDQEKFLARFGTSSGEPAWDRLRVLGPVRVLLWKSEADRSAEPVTFELWRLPDGSKLLEASVKTHEPQAAAAMRALKHRLESKGVSPDGAYESKTRFALSYFAREGGR